MLPTCFSSVLLVICVLLMTSSDRRVTGQAADDAFVHYLCTLCTPYTSDVCCSMLNKCCFDECPERNQLSCSLGQGTCHYGRCPAGQKCCPGNLFFCCVDSVPEETEVTEETEETQETEETESSNGQ